MSMRQSAVRDLDWDIRGTDQLPKRAKFDPKYDVSDRARNNITRAFGFLNDEAWPYDYAVCNHEPDDCYYVIARRGHAPSAAAVLPIPETLEPKVGSPVPMILFMITMGLGIFVMFFLNL